MGLTVGTSVSIKDINELDVYSKTTVLSIFVLMPFWYISFYVINKSFFLQMDIAIKIILPFCSATIWFFLNVAFLWLEFSIVKPDEKLENIFKIASFFSTTILCFGIWLQYKLITSIQKFLVLNVALLAFIFFIVIIYKKTQSNRKNKKTV